MLREWPPARRRHAATLARHTSQGDNEGFYLARR